MAFCENCGAPYEGSPAFCENCGSPLRKAPASASAEPNYWQADQNPNVQSQPYTAPSQEPPAQAYSTPGQSPSQPQPAYQAFRQAVEPYATGGLLAWSIITLLLCLIPGIVALVNVTQINKAATPEEQQKKIKNTKLWCIIGTVLGVLVILGNLVKNQ